jgi:phospho-N-acetylmuramoyl-pentapeptide-transferase
VFDIGSLSLGAALGTLAILLKKEILLILIGGVFVMESLSVIVQITYYRYTKYRYGHGIRIFKMAPLHHHFELKGIKEEKIVENFWKVNILLIVLGIVLKINL